MHALRSLRSIRPTPLLKRTAICLWVLVGVACVDRDARPYDEFVQDYQRIASADLGAGEPDAADPKTDTGNATDPDGGEDPEPDRCSETGGDAIDVTFANETGVAGTLVWVDFECNELPYAELAVGGTHAQSTFVGHVWRLVAADRRITQVTVAAGDTTIELQE